MVIAELIIRRLAAARRFADITNPNVNYDQEYFENVILKNLIILIIY